MNWKEILKYCGKEVEDPWHETEPPLPAAKDNIEKLKVGGEKHTRDDKGMISNTERFMHRYSTDYWDKIMPFDPKETGNKGVYTTDSKEQAQAVADRWNKNNPTKEPYFAKEIRGRFYVLRNE